MRAFQTWLMAFSLTLLIEVPIYWLIGRRFAPWWKAVIGGIIATCITHPLLTFVWAKYFTVFWKYAATGEVLVFIAETFIFWVIARPVRLKHAALTAFAANLVSFLIGLLIFMY